MQVVRSAHEVHVVWSVCKGEVKRGVAGVFERDPACKGIETLLSGVVDRAKWVTVG